MPALERRFAAFAAFHWPPRPRAPILFNEVRAARLQQRPPGGAPPVPSYTLKGMIMDWISTRSGSSRRWIRTLALCAAGGLAAPLALADCGVYGRSAAPPEHWNTASPKPGGAHRNAGIVGLWQFTFVSDGSAYPGPIPYGAVVDFGTVQWHSDGTEITSSGGRAPSTGDVCMGVWEQTGPGTYKLKHLALSWVSGDTPPPVGPVLPAAFMGPAIIRQSVTLDAASDSFTGSFTIDQYAPDGSTLLEHIAGKVMATRVTVD